MPPRETRAAGARGRLRRASEVPRRPPQAIPVVNVLIPFFWKSFAACFSADVVLMAALYAQKGAFSGGFDIEAERAAEAAAAAAAAAAEAEAPKDEAR